MMPLITTLTQSSSAAAIASIRFHKQLISTLNKSRSLSLSPMETPHCAPTPTQTVVVMRHGDRLDNFEPLWLASAARPWDPPLFESGLSRAFCTGRRLRTSLGLPIHRVFVSPFHRCLQTAAEAVAGLFPVADDPSALTSRDVEVDQSRVRASIELGLCEMLNSMAIRQVSAPEDGLFSFDVTELESLLPSQIVDRSVEPVYTELPKWQETAEDARDRYVHVIKALADKYPNENLLLVTHGEAVGVAVSAFMEDVTVYRVDYCAYAVLRRPVLSGGGESASFGEFEVDQTVRGISGIQYLPLQQDESS